MSKAAQIRERYRHNMLHDCKKLKKAIEADSINHAVIKIITDSIECAAFTLEDELQQLRVES